MNEEQTQLMVEYMRNFGAELLRTLDISNKLALKQFEEKKYSNEFLELIKNNLITVKGDKGDDGKTPEKGKDYNDGEKGVCVTKGVVDKKGHLIISLSDGQNIDCGRVVGEKGEDAVLDEEKLLKKFLSQIKFPAPEKVDREGIVSEAVKQALRSVKVPPELTAESLSKMLRKLPDELKIRYADIADAPDVVSIVKQLTANLRQGSGGGVNALSLMTDVDIPKQPVNGMVLAYDSEKQRFTLQNPSGGSGLPNGGTVGQVLTKKSDTDGDADWEDSSSEVVLNLDGGVANSTYGTLQPIDGGQAS